MKILHSNLTDCSDSVSGGKKKLLTKNLLSTCVNISVRNVTFAIPIAKQVL